MSSRRSFLWLASAVSLSARPQDLPDRFPPEIKDGPVRLPNGKLQEDEILKEEYKKNLADCKELVKLAKELEADVEKNEQYVVSLDSIKRTQQIEKLSRRIRGRMQRA